MTNGWCFGCFCITDSVMNIMIRKILSTATIQLNFGENVTNYHVYLGEKCKPTPTQERQRTFDPVRETMRKYQGIRIYSNKLKNTLTQKQAVPAEARSKVHYFSRFPSEILLILAFSPCNSKVVPNLTQK